MTDRMRRRRPNVVPRAAADLVRRIKKLVKKDFFSKIPNTSYNYSSTASTAEVTSPPIMQNRKREHHLNKMKLALPLKQRLQIVADSSQDDSSSSDGTPQRRILHEDPRYEIRGS